MWAAVEVKIDQDHLWTLQHLYKQRSQDLFKDLYLVIFLAAGQLQLSKINKGTEFKQYNCYRNLINSYS